MQCLMCNSSKDESEVIKLKCNHLFCLSCLNKYLKKHLDRKIKCPKPFCYDFFRDSQIRSILNDEDIETYESMCIKNITKTFKCLLPKCKTPIIYTDPNIQYECQSCFLFNCIFCKAAHSFITCKAFSSMNELERKTICEDQLRRAENLFVEKIATGNRKIILELDNTDLFTNNEISTCLICFSDIAKGCGVMLRCSHVFCRNCIISEIKASNHIPAYCSKCEMVLEDREIQNLLDEKDFLNYIRKCKNKTRGFLANSFNCQTPDCSFMIEYTKKPKTIICSICKAVNCVDCRAIHSNQTCEQFQKNTTFLAKEKLVDGQKVMNCLKCFQILQKVRGCDWVQCTNCGVEICWARKMLRWGPEGVGDISGGCKCRVGGILCHPSCQNCH